jgi:transcriptional regulator of acetoin/glycerol metabolism
MAAYKWPENVRELYNVWERALILADKSMLLASHLPAHIHSGSIKKNARTVGTVRAQFSKLLKQAIAAHNGNMTQVAKELGISRSTLYRKLRQQDF